MNLNQNDKQKIREELVSFMGKNPVREKSASRFINREPSLPSLKLNFGFMPTKAIAAIVMVAVLLGGGLTAYAAEDSLPGDTLYPVKNMSEGVRGWMKWSEESRAEWKATMAERKLEEIEALYDEGEITEEQKDELIAKVNEWLEKADAHIEKMKEKGEVKGAFMVSAKLENAMANHQRILEKMSEKFGEASEKAQKFGEKMEKFSEKLEEHAEKFEQKRIQFEEKVKEQKGEGMNRAAEGKKKALENKIEEIEKFIELKKDSLSEEDLAAAQEKLEEMKNALEAGNTNLEEGEHGEALVEFTKGFGLKRFAKPHKFLKPVDETDDDEGDDNDEGDGDEESEE